MIGILESESIVCYLSEHLLSIISETIVNYPMSNTKSNRFIKKKKKRRLFFPKWEWYHDPTIHRKTEWYEGGGGGDEYEIGEFRTYTWTNKSRFWSNVIMFIIFGTPIFIYLWFFIRGIIRTM